MNLDQLNNHNNNQHQLQSFTATHHHHHHHPLHSIIPTRASTTPSSSSNAQSSTNTPNPMILSISTTSAHQQPLSTRSSISSPSSIPSPPSPATSLSSLSSFPSSSNHPHPHHHQSPNHVQSPHSLASLTISPSSSSSSTNTNNNNNPNNLPSHFHSHLNPHHDQSIKNRSSSILQQQTNGLGNSTPATGGHLQNRTIPPPISILSTISSKADDQQSISDDLMTARCAQFPIDSLQPRHSTSTAASTTTSSLGSSRFQPYLPSSCSSSTTTTTLPNDPSSTWPSSDSKPIIVNPPRSLFIHSHHHQVSSPSSFPGSLDDASLSSNELHSSCSSLASSTKSSSNSSSGYLTSSTQSSLSFQDPSVTLPSGPGDTLYPPLAPPGFSQTSAYPPYNGPTQLPSSRLVYPPNAFSPSGGSPPIASASSAYFHFDSVGAGRRHTVSAYPAPMPIELSLVGNPDLDETLVKEEKRRRNKESSQRFRDRTRERMREKQERLEYLERRTKELEQELRGKTQATSAQDSASNQDASGQSTSHSFSGERDMIEKLQAENDSLKSTLKIAAEEITRLRQLAGNQSPHSPLNINKFYATLAQLSPAASTDFAPGSQSSSPTGEPSYFVTTTRGTSPASDTASATQRHGQQTSAAQSNPISYTPAEHRSQLPQQQRQQLAYHSSQQPMSTSASEFWDQSNEAGALATGWQTADQQQQS